MIALIALSLSHFTLTCWRCRGKHIWQHMWHHKPLLLGHMLTVGAIAIGMTGHEMAEHATGITGACSLLWHEFISTTEEG